MMNSHSEQAAVKRLRARLYPEGVEKARKGKTGQVEVKLNELADFLAENPSYSIPKGEPMACAKCSQPLSGGEFRVCYQAGWFCRYCYGALSLAPLGARCVYCKKTIEIADWRYGLHSVMKDGAGLKRFFYHQDCEAAARRLTKAA